MSIPSVYFWRLALASWRPHVLLFCLLCCHACDKTETSPRAVGPQRYFSNDDGKTWFADDANKLPPFSKDGKEAARAYVFRCADGKEFVAFLERLTPASKKKFDAMTARTGKPPDLMQADVVRPSDFEVKVPGQPNWILVVDPRAAVLMTPKCADGSAPQILMP